MAERTNQPSLPDPARLAAWAAGYCAGWDRRGPGMFAAGYAAGAADSPVMAGLIGARPAGGGQSRSRAGDWPGVDNLDPDSRRTVYAALLATWDQP